MLARIDGKSPVEYLPEESIQKQVREIAKQLILQCPETLEECLERTFGQCPFGLPVRVQGIERAQNQTDVRALLALRNFDNPLVTDSCFF